MAQNESLDALIEAVRAGANYRGVCREVIANVGARELTKRRSLKEAIKATKNTLHQVGGAFLGPAMTYERWLADLRASDDPRATCRAIMAGHASTRERLPILEAFYAAIFAETGRVASVLDVACGLHPLGIPWMDLAPGATYLASDIYEPMLAFLDGAMATWDVRGSTLPADATHFTPSAPVDLAFVLKALPPLEAIDRDAPLRLLDAIAARHIVVSYPVSSLGGKSKGMAANYEARFRDLVDSRPWAFTRHLFATELVFIIRKD